MESTEIGIIAAIIIFIAFLKNGWPTKRNSNPSVILAIFGLLLLPLAHIVASYFVVDIANEAIKQCTMDQGNLVGSYLSENLGVFSFIGESIETQLNEGYSEAIQQHLARAIDYRKWPQILMYASIISIFLDLLCLYFKGTESKTFLLIIRGGFTLAICYLVYSGMVIVYDVSSTRLAAKTYGLFELIGGTSNSYSGTVALFAVAYFLIPLIIIHLIHIKCANRYFESKEDYCPITDERQAADRIAQSQPVQKAVINPLKSDNSQHMNYNKEITIGRYDSCDIRFNQNDVLVSSHHGIIFMNGNQLMYKDTSTNGTIINNSMIHHMTVPIKHGDTILIAGKYPISWYQIDACLNKSFRHASKSSFLKQYKKYLLGGLVVVLILFIYLFILQFLFSTASNGDKQDLRSVKKESINMSQSEDDEFAFDAWSGKTMIYGGIYKNCQTLCMFDLEKTGKETYTGTISLLLGGEDDMERFSPDRGMLEGKVRGKTNGNTITIVLDEYKTEDPYEAIAYGELKSGQQIFRLTYDKGNYSAKPVGKMEYFFDGVTDETRIFKK